VADVSGLHPDLGPELRQLAQSILDRIDPAIRAAAALAAARAGDTPGKCQQVWCPVCALAALVTGEEHPLLAVVSEHSVALLAAIRALVDATDPHGSPPEGPAGGAAAAESGASNRSRSETSAGRYQPIPVTVEE
jgi:hypothetical protein